MFRFLNTESSHCINTIHIHIIVWFFTYSKTQNSMAATYINDINDNAIGEDLSHK